MKYHPDRNKSIVAHNTTLKINAAYEVLSDKEKRQEYDLAIDYNDPIETHYYSDHYGDGTYNDGGGYGYSYGAPFQQSSNTNYENDKSSFPTGIIFLISLISLIVGLVLYGMHYISRESITVITVLFVAVFLFSIIMGLLNFV